MKTIKTIHISFYAEKFEKEGTNIITAGASLFCLSLTFCSSFLLMVVGGFSPTTVVCWQVTSSLNYNSNLSLFPAPHRVCRSHDILSLPSTKYSPLESFSSFSSIAQSYLTLWPHESQHARPPCPSPTPGASSNSCPSSRWCHPAISFSVIPFSSCPQSLPASESFPMSQLFAWGGQSIGVSALASFLPKKSQSWSPSEWTGWISLQSKGLSRVFSKTTVQKHQFFSTQLSSQSNSHIHTWPLEKNHSLD